MAQVNEFLPEIDVYYKVTDELRVWMQAKETYEAGDPVTAEFGPSLDFCLKPMVRLENITAFDLDDIKSRPLIFSIGYRCLPYPGSPPTNRMEPIVTFNFQVPKIGLLLTDRNRGDLDWQHGGFTWRYRNRLQLERNARITPTICSPTPALSSSTSANTASGPTLQSTSDAFSQSASTSKSIPTTNTRTKPTKAPISSTTSSAGS